MKFLAELVWWIMAVLSFATGHIEQGLLAVCAAQLTKIANKD
jgi:hypothetical protein